MLFNIIALVLVLAITFMHSIFGLFSGLINVFCCIIAAVVALGSYDALNQVVTGSLNLNSAYTEPICLVVLFVLTLLLLRTLADNYIRGNVTLPMYVDWGGGAVCGFVNAQLCVGILIIGILMLPIGGTKLGFSRYVRVEGGTDAERPYMAQVERQSFWTRSDEFTAGLVSLISSGSMRSKRSFAEVYPDFTDAVFLSTNTVQPESLPSPLRAKKTGGDGFTKGLTVEEWWERSDPLDVRYRKDAPTEKNPKPPLSPQSFKPGPGMKLIGVRMTLGSAAADRQKTSKKHLFRPTQIRLVGQADKHPRQYPARVLNTGDKEIRGANRLVNFDDNFSLEGGDQEIDAYFEVDQDFVPSFVEYRRHARAELTRANLKEDAPLGAIATKTDSSKNRQEKTPRFYNRQGSGENFKLPFNVKLAALRSGVTIKAKQLVKGRFSGNRTRFESNGNEPETNAFAVPDGSHMLQVRYTPQKAQSIVGDVFNFVGQLNQFSVRDDRGNEHRLVGYYAIVKRGRNQFVELFYNGAPDDPADPSFRYMLDFKSVNRKELDAPDAEVGLLFLIDRGDVRITKLEIGNKEYDAQFSISP